MNLRFCLPFASKLPLSWAWALGVGPALLLSGCRHEVVVAPAYDDYFPVVLNTYRTYAVSDSSWLNGKVTVSQYQFRERVSEQFTDAAGQPAYRLVRSKRLTPAEAWRDDSVLVVQVLPRAVLLTRNNVRTVELIYPARAGQGWNGNAFSVSTFQPDTIINLTRYYGPAVGGAYTTLAAGGQPAKTYPVTVATRNTQPGGINDVNAYSQRGTQQVYASGVGLVWRRRFSYYTFTTSANGFQTITRGIVQNGASRSETLLETGTL
ncbi:hypothetical protein GO988_05190 [Hymenobacter sp. HMF4947]|uniref:Uncharacterized protein n=1 Tax=Hymenobacter ginkgonis TaxID=2682976 RepID=A0A7K1TBF7_9BACT|nr:hypothetical protein [Hymenobacter ginkgonis]MVN75715.1 hypothetical protein [Hymenobacter ginkgonis]